MAGERILIVSDNLQGPTGFAVNAQGVAWSLADEYDVHVLGLQEIMDREIILDIEGDPRKVIQHRNYPRERELYDFGRRSLPILLDELKPDILITVNDIQMVSHVPSVLCPDSITLKIADLPAKKILDNHTILTHLEGELIKFKEKYPRDVKWLAYCFTPDTDVLTVDGIKKITEIKKGDEVYSWNPETKKIEIATVTGTQKIHYSGILVGIKHQKVDFLVTPEHIFNLNNREMPAESLLNLTDRALRRFPKNDGFSFCERRWMNFYEYFDDNYILRSKWLYENRDKIPANDRKAWHVNHSNGEYFMEARVGDIKDISWYAEHDKTIYAKSSPRNQERIPLRVRWHDFMELAGWYIAEGYLEEKKNKIRDDEEYESYRVCISQVKENGRAKICSLLDRMGLKYSKTNNRISIAGRFFYKLFEKLFHRYGRGAKFKYIPKEFFKYDGLWNLIRALIDGDGTWDKREKSIGRISTVSEKLRDDIIIACKLLGFHISVRRDENGSWSILISKTELRPIISKRHIYTKEYDGYVYDITLDKNNYFFAGRNFKFNITHNCPQDGEPPMPYWKQIYLTADKVIAMSKYGQYVFKEYFNMDVDYIWHGVDSETFKPMEKPDELQDKFVVGDLNRNQPRKQPARLIEAFAKFAKDKNDVLLHMQMDWNDVFGYPIGYFIDLYGLRHKVILPLQVGAPRKEIARIYNMWDVSVNPTAGEGFGLTTIEAGACGKPTIITDYTTSRELVLDGEPSPRGILVPYVTLLWERFNVAAVQRALIDIDKLAEALQYYYDNRDELEKHGRNAREWVLRNVTLRKLQYRWKEVVKEVLNQ